MRASSYWISISLGFPGSPVFPTQGAQVQSLVWELRSHISWHRKKKKNCHSSHMKKTTTVNFYIFKNVWLLHHALYTKYNKKAKNVYIKIWSMLSHNIYGFICWWMHPKFCESFKKHFKQYLALELHFYLLNLGMIILIISATQTVGQGPLLSPPRVN